MDRSQGVAVLVCAQYIAAEERNIGLGLGVSPWVGPATPQTQLSAPSCEVRCGWRRIEKGFVDRFQGVGVLVCAHDIAAEEQNIRCTAFGCRQVWVCEGGGCKQSLPTGNA